MYPSFPFINRELIDYYYDQLMGDLKETSIAKRTFELSFSGPKYSILFEKDNQSINHLKKLEKLLDYLEARRQISFIRPNYEREYWEDPDFGYERTIATKMFFPKAKLEEISGLSHLVVWVSNPDPKALTKGDWRFKGTFLYLIEQVNEVGKYGITLSGCSALNTIANLVRGHDFFMIDADEPLGRGNYDHPIDKLKNIGAIRIGEAVIETIYRKRYFSDEQCFTHENNRYRCNELLGYPLFINVKY